MRETIGAAVGRLMIVGSVAGVLIANTGDDRLEAHALGGLNTVTVSPTHGKAASSFAVTYGVSPCVGAAGLTIAFSWNALPPAGQLLGTATTDSNCRATLSTTPPVNLATHAGAVPGNYQVFGYVALPSGGSTPNTEASATYTVDVTPTPTATATTRATATAKVTSQPTASATSAPTTSASAASSAAASPSAAAGANLSGHAAAAAGAQSEDHPGGWALTWQLLGAVLLVALLLAIVLALLAGWIIRGRRARAGTGERNDRAA